MTNVTCRRPFGELGDQQLLDQAKRLAANQRSLEVHILDHLDEIDRRGLALRRGFSSLFDYTVNGCICKYYNSLLSYPQYPVIAFVTPCHGIPTILDLLRSGAVTRAEPGTMTVDGADRGSATAAPTSLTFSHATLDTVKTVDVNASTMALSRAECAPSRTPTTLGRQGDAYLLLWADRPIIAVTLYSMTSFDKREETLTPNPSVQRIADSVVTGTIGNDDPLPRGVAGAIRLCGQ